MILSELALRVVNDPETFKYEDLVECYQFINDNGLVDQLNTHQNKFLNRLVESGSVTTDIWRV